MQTERNTAAHQNEVSRQADTTAETTFSETAEVGSLTGATAAVKQAKTNSASFTPANALKLQRLVGNRTVGQIIARKIAARPQIARAIQPATIQRKVFIKGTLWGYNEKTRTKTQKNIAGIEDLFSDSIKRYFASKAEFYSFAKGEINTMGYLNKKSSWVRLPDELLVLGETHTETTLLDIVKATGTDKFKYEAYTAAPENSPQTAAAMESQKGDKNVKGGLARDNATNHDAEDFFPKIIRGLQGIAIADSYINCSEAEGKLAYLCLLMSKEAEDTTTVNAFYVANKALLDTVIGQMAGGTILGKTEFNENATNKKVLKDFIAEATAYATQKVAAAQTGAAGKADFDAAWGPIPGNDYSQDPNAPMMKGEKARDFSLWQHIQQAKNDGFLLFGIGELHHKRLTPLLEDAGIKHKYMDNFIAEEKTKYPQ